jgi:hypothetical protein
MTHDVYRAQRVRNHIMEKQKMVMYSSDHIMTCEELDKLHTKQKMVMYSSDHIMTCEELDKLHTKQKMIKVLILIL